MDEASNNFDNFIASSNPDAKADDSGGQESNQNEVVHSTEPKFASSNEIHHSNHHCHGKIDHDDQTIDDEAAHFNKIAESFLYYRRHSEDKLRSKIRSFRSLPENHRALVPNFKEHLRQIYRCISENYEFLKAVISSTGRIFEDDDVSSRRRPRQNHDHDSNLYFPVSSEFNMEKLQSTMRQIVRDWSSTGEAERRRCYDPILNRLIELFPQAIDRKNAKVLVPGAGLGRLSFEIAKLGFECQGNEFSLFMLFVSNFILNRCKLINEWSLYPYIHQWTNNWTYDDQIRLVQFPDADPSGLPEDSNFSMTAGDFLEVYGESREEHRAKWDVVATVFFIDTAHNAIAYLETISRILKTGGYWLNLGPLLYHFSDMENEISLELPYEEILNIAKKLGFEIIDNSNLSTTYTQNASCMLTYEYHCAYTVFKKL